MTDYTYSSDLKKMFEPVVSKIEKLVQTQVNKITIKQAARYAFREKHGIDAIFLVGGFGSNEYLKDRLKQRFVHIPVIQPSDAWAAIVK